MKGEQIMSGISGYGITKGPGGLSLPPQSAVSSLICELNSVGSVSATSNASGTKTTYDPSSDTFDGGTIEIGVSKEGSATVVETEYNPPSEK